MLVNAYHDYCIIGAGPSGLQLGYFFQKAARDYVIYEKSNVSGMLRSAVLVKTPPPPIFLASARKRQAVNCKGQAEKRSEKTFEPVRNFAAFHYKISWCFSMEKIIVT